MYLIFFKAITDLARTPWAATPLCKLLDMSRVGCNDYLALSYIEC